MPLKDSTGQPGRSPLDSQMLNGNVLSAEAAPIDAFFTVNIDHVMATYKNCGYRYPFHALIFGLCPGYGSSAGKETLI